MRLKIRVDFRKPLTRKKKICKKDKSEVIVQCKYEKLGDFCFVCGLLSHTERFCKKKLEGDGVTVTREWGGWLRAPPKRGAGGSKSKWLREEGDGGWSSTGGKESNNHQNSWKVNPEFQQSNNDLVNRGEKSGDKAEILGGKGGSNIVSNVKFLI